jgi:hypothetical protein
MLATAVAASAQQTTPSFNALAGRIRINQEIWVTDASGREVRGRLRRLAADSLDVDADGSRTFAAADVRRLRARDRDPLKNGVLIGLGIGGSLGTAWCIGAIADDSGDIDAGVECAEGFTVFPALGALFGLAVDVLRPGRIHVIYEASGAGQAARSRLSIAPVISSRVRGLAVTFAF